MINSNLHTFIHLFRDCKLLASDKTIKIKIEVDTQPPLKFRVEQKLLLQPHSFMPRYLVLPDLFAGKMH